MAGAGGSWNKGKFTPAKSKRTVAQVATIKREARPVVAKVTGPPPKPRPQMGQNPTGRPKMTQTGMFTQGEDSPLFSGAAQRGEQDAYKPQQAGRQERLGGDYDEYNPAKRWTGKTTYTPEYDQARQDQERIRSKSGMSHDDLMKQDSEYRDATNRLEQEKELSQAARDHGYDPAKMDKKDWADLSEKLEGEAKEQLRYADKADREAAGNKLRGKPDTWQQVGGQPRLVRSGATRREADEKTRQLNARTKDAADDYMGRKLVDYGYNREKVDKLNYDQKRRLVAEIGHGEVQKTEVPGISLEERSKVVYSTSDYARRDAKDVALNPRAGKGLETWGNAMMAAERADKEIDLPPESIYDNARSEAPGYVRRSNPAPKYQNDAILF